MSAGKVRVAVRTLASVCDTCGHTYNFHASAGMCERVKCPCARFVDKGATTEITTDDHDARPSDGPGPDRCKDCGGPITWVGPWHTDWEHVDREPGYWFDVGEGVSSGDLWSFLSVVDKEALVQVQELGGALARGDEVASEEVLQRLYVAIASLRPRVVDGAARRRGSE